MTLTCLSLFVVSALVCQGADGPDITAALDPAKAEIGTRVRLVIEVSGEEAADCYIGKAPVIEGAMVEGITGPDFEIRLVNDPKEGMLPTRLVARFEIVFIPQAIGLLTIPPVEVAAQRGKIYFTPSLKFEALKSGFPKDGALLRVEPAKASVYVHERVRFRIRLSIGAMWFEAIERAPGGEVLSLPWFIEEPFRVALETDGPEEGRASRSIKVIETSSRLAFAFERTGEGDQEICDQILEVSFLPTEPGRFTVSPSTYSVELAGGEAVFCRSLPFELEVNPLPLAGRPASATNGVGVFKVRFDLEKQEMIVGDPVRLFFQVEGEGNLPFLELPDFKALEERFRIYAREDERSKRMVRRIYHLAPMSVHVEELPGLAFSYFDPDQERYVTANWGPKKITVAPGDAKAVGTRPGMEEIETIMRTFHGGSWGDALRPLALTCLLMSAAVLVWTFVRSRRSVDAGRAQAEARARGAYGAFLRTIGGAAASRSESSGAADLHLLARGVSDYLSARFEIASSKTLADAPGKLLEDCGISRELSHEMDLFLRRIDTGRFGSTGEDVDPEPLFETARVLVERMEREIGK